jgi:dihydroxy-acid dehydratase
MWRATGLKDGDFGKTIIAVANSFTQFVPGHVKPGDVVLVRYEGPRGGRACKKCSTPPGT